MHLLSTTNYQVKTFEKDTMIAYSGDSCETLYILLSGEIRGEITSFDGKAITIEKTTAPNSIAEGYLFADDNKLKINIVAHSDCKLLFIYKPQLLNILNKNENILKNYLKITSNRFVNVSSKLKLLNIKTVKGKLANHLLALEKSNNGKQNLKLNKTHQELANFLGITRPALTRNLLQLKHDDIISISGKEIRILDKEKLSALLY